MSNQSRKASAGLILYCNSRYNRMPRARPSPPPSPASAPHDQVRRRWLLLVHQLPPVPSNLRVRTWRRLQGLGAVAIKQAVYVLPDTAEAREDFQWIKVEIEGSGGEAAVFAADNLDPAADAAMVEAFRRARQQDYAELGKEIERASRTRSSDRSGQRSRGPRDQLPRLRERFAAIERLDFFSSAGRDRVAALLESLEGLRGRSPAARDAVTDKGKADRASYQHKLWVTRPRPGIDRVGSAWLIRRFIDAKARFGFVTDAKTAPEGSIPFDMFGAGFGHEGDRCTFEGLQSRFDIRDPAVKRLGELVHDLDLKDRRYGAPEAPTVEATIEGLRLSHSDDSALLEQGMALFEALYRSFAQAKRQPKAVAAAKKKGKVSRNAPGRHRAPTS
jgi:hypothetical protein